MGFHLALGIFLRGVAEGEGVVSEDHRAARSEGLHVQAGIGTAPGIVGRQHGRRIHREGFAAGREKPPCSPGWRTRLKQGDKE